MRYIKKVIISLFILMIVLFPLCSVSGASSFYVLKISVDFVPNVIFSTYDVDVFLNDYKLITLPHGEDYFDSFYVEEGPNIIYFYKNGDKAKDVMGSIIVDIKGNTDVTCSISCSSNKISPDDISIERLDDISEILVENSFPRDELAQLQEFYDDCLANGSANNLQEMISAHGLFADCIIDNQGYKNYKVARSCNMVKMQRMTDLNSAGNYIVIRINGAESGDIESVVFHRDGDDHYDETLNGRGSSDYGRIEPQYVGVIGYVALYDEQAYRTIEQADDYTDESLWVVPTYERDKQFWNENGVLPHKTEVVVREQFIAHSRYGSYPGYLLVEKTDDKTQYYINVLNFITKPYWTYQDDLITAAKTGYFLAEYHQVSDYYPIHSGGSKANLKEGIIVLVKRYVSSSHNTEIEAVWGKSRLRYFFNPADLTIIY